MAILIDYNQIMLASLFARLKGHATDIYIEEDPIRHMFLNTIRSVRKKYYKDFGEIVICADGKNSWRKAIFPYYKAGRKEARSASELDWDHLFDILNTVREELKEVFPYKVIHIDRVEADDVIGTICHTYGTPLNSGEPFLIYSSDKDYIQLHKYGNVRQFNPVLKKWVTNSDPEQYLIEHILRGDKGDGIPNVLMADNSIVLGERSKAMTAKRIAALADVDNMDTQTKTRYYRNKMLIDLNEIPDEYKEEIIQQYDQEPTNGRSKLFNYFIAKGLKHLLSDIGDF